MSERTILNLKGVNGDIDKLIGVVNKTAIDMGVEENHLFRKNSYNHPVAIDKHVAHDGSFEAFPNRLTRKTPEVLSAFKKFEDVLGISDLTLSRYITRFQPKDFLLWRQHKEGIAKFISIATTQAHLNFKDETILFPPYYGIIFNPSDIHAVMDVKAVENWIVFLIPKHSQPMKQFYENNC